MNTRLKRKLEGFKRIVAASPDRARYHFSGYTPHEQAIREHIKRGFGAGLDRISYLLSQGNKI